MAYAVPVVDLENVQLEAVRAGARELGAVQVVNHGVPGELGGLPHFRLTVNEYPTWTYPEEAGRIPAPSASRAWTPAWRTRPGSTTTGWAARTTSPPAGRPPSGCWPWRRAAVPGPR